MRILSIAVAVATGLALAGSAYAQKGNDNNPGHGHGGGPPGKAGNAPSEAPAASGQGAGAAQGGIVIAPHDRDAVYNYYRREYAAGNCPPGLAKKNNGCLPPGQAKKMWAIGQPLPAGVAYYPLPVALLGQLTPAPAGYQYVQVANDILLMAVGTRMIAGALADLGSM
ncbi:hypothetical protein SAMN02745126_02265 [Enhydrobacter aerosaccus]|uniref:Nickel/cobalt transporter regulator n=1 Tax=Enhydrobacter aerosaccus TaxID=225324 RepID=A0A1T4NFL9_9HYPH|nr:hypothetical protein [Enhydrobacter aerosaccus]SJZ78014.1 hypothetical protein SAMN02745126_02265 [Enhydrobacter aerosaccus]